MWITSLIFDAIECTLVLVATHDPEKGPPAMTLKFQMVGALKVNRYHDVDELCLGDFGEVEERKLPDNRSEFKIDTGDAVLVFEAGSDYVTQQYRE